MNQDTAIVIVGAILFISLAVIVRGWPTFIKIERHYHYGKKVKPPKQQNTVDSKPTTGVWYQFETKTKPTK